MKTVRILLLSIFFIPISAWAQGPEYRVGVDGLACPFCAYGVEKQLQKLDGVRTVDVDLAKGEVVITTEDGKVLNEGQAEAAVKKAGFSLRSFTRSEDVTP